MPHRITYVMNTCNRPDRLRRSLPFYARTTMNILICDASEESNEELVKELGGNRVSYRYLPGVSPLQRCLWVLDQIKTPYVQWITDDDFYLESGTLACVDFLQRHPGYSAAVGLVLLFQEEGLEVRYTITEPWAFNTTLEQDDPLERIIALWAKRPGIAQFTAFRIAQARPVLELMCLHDDSLGLYETILLSALAAAGKIRFLNVPFKFMEQSLQDSESARVVTIDRMVADPRFEAELADYKTYLEKLAHIYPSRLRPDPKDYAQGVYDAVVKYYTKIIRGPGMELWPLFRSRWNGQMEHPQFLFEPIQHVELDLYNPQFFKILEDVDLRIRMAGLRDMGIGAKLDEYSMNAVQLIDLGKEADAMKALEEIHSLTPFHRPTVDTLISLYHKTGQDDRLEFLQAWRQRLEEASRVPTVSNGRLPESQEEVLQSFEVCLLQIDAAVQRKDLLEADRLSLELVDIFPNEPLGWTARSMILRATGRFSGAVEAARKAAEMKQDPEMLFELMQAYAADSQQAAALQVEKRLKSSHGEWLREKTALQNHLKAKRIGNKKERPLHIVMVDGGLGSQMTQYGIGVLLQEKLDVDVKYDLTWFKISGKDKNKIKNRNFVLRDVFDINDFEEATKEEIYTYKRLYHYNHSKYCFYDENLLKVRCDRYIDGYFGNYRYLWPINALLRKKFSFNLALSDRNQDFLKQIQSAENSIALHVRRGDYSGSMYDILDKDYYQRAVRFLAMKISSKQMHFFIFSDDIAWVRANLAIPYPSTYVDSNGNDDGAFDMYLMSQCKHFVIANSGFSNWAATLGSAPDKLVIAPERAFNMECPEVQSNPALRSSLEGHDDPANRRPDWIYLPVSSEGGGVSAYRHGLRIFR